MAYYIHVIYFQGLKPFLNPPPFHLLGITTHLAILGDGGGHTLLEKHPEPLPSLPSPLGFCLRVPRTPRGSGTPVSLLQHQGALPRPKSGSCLTPGNELSEETHMLTEQETSVGRGPRGDRGRVRDPGELLCHVAHGPGFYADGIRFWVVSGQSL